MIKHRHHIVPKHMDGSNDPSNIVELTIQQHAQAHLELYEKYGKWQDQLAYRMLMGHVSAAEAIKEAQRKGDKTWMQTEWGKALLRAGQARRHRRSVVWNHGLTKELHPTLLENSTRSKNDMKLGKIRSISEWHNERNGKPFTEQHLDNLRRSLAKTPRIECEHCGGWFKAGMLKRWHGDRCRLKGI